MKETEKSIAETKLNSQNTLIEFLQKTIAEIKTIGHPKDNLKPEPIQVQSDVKEKNQSNKNLQRGQTSS